MITYAVGKPGEAVRQFVDAVDEEEACLNCKPDEVAVEVPDMTKGMICAAGVSVIPSGFDMDAELDRIRHIRTAKLSACDWTQGLDAQITEEKRQKWAVYRQALRDITTTQADVLCDDIEWPEEPSQ